jgi:hypothetical protein
MTDEQLQKHDWDDVRNALYDLMEHTSEHEPHAVSYIYALDEVLAGLPEND